jgi:hypothetical protein
MSAHASVRLEVAERAGDLLRQLRHPQVRFGLIMIEGDREVAWLGRATGVASKVGMSALGDLLRPAERWASDPLRNALGNEGAKSAG